MEDLKKDIAIEVFMLDWIRRRHRIDVYKSDSACHAIGSGPDNELTAHLLVNGRTQCSYTLDEILKEIQ